MPANVNVSGEVWRHALNAVRFRPGDPIEWWEDGSRWRGVVVESDHATFRVKVRGAPDRAPPAPEGTDGAD